MAHRSYFISLRSIRVSSFQHLRQVPAGGQAAGSKGPTARHPPAAAAPRSAPSMVQKGRPDAPPEGSAETPNRPAAAIRKRNAAPAARTKQNSSAAVMGRRIWPSRVETAAARQKARGRAWRQTAAPAPAVQAGRAAAAARNRDPRSGPANSGMPSRNRAYTSSAPAAVHASASTRCAPSICAGCSGSEKKKCPPRPPASGKKRIRLTAGPAASAAIWAVTAAPSSSVQTAAIASCQSVSPPASGSRRSRQDSTPQRQAGRIDRQKQSQVGPCLVPHQFCHQRNTSRKYSSTLLPCSSRRASTAVWAIRRPSRRNTTSSSTFSMSPTRWVDSRTAASSL